MAVSSSKTNGFANGTCTANPASPLPLIISGGGCVGLFLALLLSSLPCPAHIFIIEPDSPDPTLTRAMAHQPSTYPILSRVPGLLPQLIRAGSLSSGLCFRTSIACGGRVIAEKRFENGVEGMKGKGQLLLPQGKFQEIMLRMLEGRDVEVKRGWRVKGVVARGKESVSVEIGDGEGRREVLEGAYLIAADGGKSIVRKDMGILFQGDTLDAQLVALDLHFPFESHCFHDANFIIDPVNYGLIGRILPATPTSPALWRVSYGVSNGLSAAEVEAGVDTKLAAMLPNQGLDAHRNKAYRVVQVAPYKAQQLLAETMYTDHVCLVGDAAHLTNPYAGLGLASGLADASSLADVMNRILTGNAKEPATLLQSWSAARRRTFLSAVDKPSRMAYQRVRRDVSSDEKVHDMMTMDPMVGALRRGMPAMPALSLETKGEELEGW
ncbi:hypothetical protein DE146DRAFT_172370 [Phaeosphaeria sp. MPI-PUGE-AT-0046c]|nr:hypothetical protein DE146DRAFT_172370 [Phaeosphaeria sp. MPI-PUGE-AT-0046c]